MADAPPPPVAAPPGAVTFALVPGDVTGVIDYARIAVAWQSTARPPSLSTKTLLITSMLSLLACRPSLLSLVTVEPPVVGTLKLPRTMRIPSTTCLNLLDNHGRFTTEHLHPFCTTYVNNQSRAAQQNMQMVTCILASLSLPGFLQSANLAHLLAHWRSPCCCSS